MASTDRDERCTCSHGGEDRSDHTPGIGCERRDCPCRYWSEDEEPHAEVEFEHTQSRIEVTMWYSVQGAPIIMAQNGRRLSPCSARFTFVDGEPLTLLLGAYPVLRDGSISDKWQRLDEIQIWNQRDWPEWLHDLYKIACADFAADQRSKQLISA